MAEALIKVNKCRTTGAGVALTAVEARSGDVRRVAAVPPEDTLRANTYGLLAALLRSEPDQELLNEIAGLSGDDSELGRAIGELAENAGRHDAESVADEFQVLFIGIGESELEPYASYYRTGFMYEKPLANIRVALADLGLAQADDVAEPEDHIAALCETMRALITGALDMPVPIDRQKEFFNAHVRPWAGLFFVDLENAEHADFYRPVGTIGRLFMTIESRSFEMTG